MQQAPAVIHIPLEFWFCKSDRSALPADFILLQHYDPSIVVVHVDPGAVERVVRCMADSRGARTQLLQA